MKLALIAALLLTCAGDAPAPAICAQKTYFQSHVWADPSLQFCEEVK